MSKRHYEKHGLTGGPTARRKLYAVWSAMRHRCRAPGHSRYHRYGGRGICVCREWQLSVACFVAWAEANGWEDGLEIDRKDNDGDYEPSNCRFVTPSENKRNTSRTVMMTAFGETKPLIVWVEDSRCTVSVGTLRARIAGGWAPEDAVQSPLHRKSPACRSRFMERQVDAAIDGMGGDRDDAALRARLRGVSRQRRHQLANKNN